MSKSRDPISEELLSEMRALRRAYSRRGKVAPGHLWSDVRWYDRVSKGKVPVSSYVSWDTVLAVDLPAGHHGLLTGLGLDAPEDAWDLLLWQVSVDGVPLGELTPSDGRRYQGFYGPLPILVPLVSSPSARKITVQAKRKESGPEILVRARLIAYAWPLETSLPALPLAPGLGRVNANIINTPLPVSVPTPLPVSVPDPLPVLIENVPVPVSVPDPLPVTVGNVPLQVSVPDPLPVTVGNVPLPVTLQPPLDSPLQVQLPEPLSVVYASGAEVGRLPIEEDTQGNNTLVTGVADQQIKVFGFMLFTTNDLDVTFKSGPTTSLSGVLPLRTDNGRSITAVVTPMGFHHFETAPGEDLVLNLSSQVQVSGWLVYVQE